MVEGEKSDTQTGKYRLSEGMSNNELLILRSGQQAPVKVSFNNQHTLQDLAGGCASD